jgi:gamma-glutamylcyclotransferase (GGCT)/AIG2-like uncharacterized protein YtfP
VKETNNMKFVKIFVYGTLKIDGCYSEQLDKYRHSSEIATLRGTLFNAEYFPALIEKGNNIIYGELHVYKSPKIVLSIIDRIEGFIGKKSEKNLYIRKKTEVQPKNSNKCSAYVYFFAHNTNKMEQIEDGKWKI